MENVLSINSSIIKFPHILWKTGFHCAVDELLIEGTFSVNLVEKWIPESKFPVELDLSFLDEFTLKSWKSAFYLHFNGILFSTIVEANFPWNSWKMSVEFWYSIGRWLQSLLEIEFSAFNLKSFRGQSNADIAPFTLFALSLNGAASSGKGTFSAPLIFWHRFRSQIYLYI